MLVWPKDTLFVKICYAIDSLGVEDTSYNGLLLKIS